MLDHHTTSDQRNPDRPFTLWPIKAGRFAQAVSICRMGRYAEGTVLSGFDTVNLKTELISVAVNEEPGTERLGFPVATHTDRGLSHNAFRLYGPRQ